jgi:prepilin-type N-terminal cleavage/methylation domain-containing protein
MNNHRGFSLLEVLVAVTIIGIGFSVVFTGMSGSVRGLERIDSNDRRVELARMKLAELDLVQRIRPGDSASGVFADGTRWSLQVFPFIAPVQVGPRRNPSSVVRIVLTLEWMGRNKVQTRELETYRYLVDDNRIVPSLQEQLHALE